MALRKTNPLAHGLEPLPPPVFLNCESISPPIRFPSDSKITILELSPNLHGFSEVISSAADPDGVWPSKEMSRLGLYRCCLENDGDSPIYSVAFVFKVIFKEAVKPERASGNARKSGAITFSHDREVTIPKVAAHGAFTFYIRNHVAQFADVQIPEFITLKGINGSKRSRVRLKQATPDGLVWMSFAPVLTESTRGNDTGATSATGSNSQSQGRKRGPKPDHGTATRVAAVVARVAPDGDWRLKMDDICDALDEEAILCPKTWRSKDKTCRHWSDQLDRSVCVKAIQYRLDLANPPKKKTTPETFS